MKTFTDHMHLLITRFSSLISPITSLADWSLQRITPNSVAEAIPECNYLSPGQWPGDECDAVCIYVNCTFQELSGNQVVIYYTTDSNCNHTQECMSCGC